MDCRETPPMTNIVNDLRSDRDNGSTMLPDETTAWRLTYDDLFDRETPTTVEQTGIGISEGLVVLWHKTLHEGVDAKGRRTFSQFCLRWERGHASVPIHFADPDATLAKLRAWAFPPLPDGMKSETAWMDGCPTSPHGVNDGLLRKLAYLHLRLVTIDEQDGFYDAARRLLAICETLTDPDELG
jgi:hypothetical protein